MLKDSNYLRQGESKGVARLLVLYVRCQRGLLSYEGLPLHELELYASQRALPTIEGQEATVATLTTHLEEADDNVTFRLSDLPPELRKIVFSHYFNSFSEPIHDLRYSAGPDLRCQPPITCISRIIREESLPLFYGSFDFAVNIFDDHPGRDFMTCSGLTQRLLQLTTADQFGWIRHIKA